MAVVTSNWEPVHKMAWRFKGKGGRKRSFGGGMEGGCRREKARKSRDIYKRTKKE